MELDGAPTSAEASKDMLSRRWVEKAGGTNVARLAWHASLQRGEAVRLPIVVSVRTVEEVGVLRRQFPVGFVEQDVRGDCRGE